MRHVRGAPRKPVGRQGRSRHSGSVFAGAGYASTAELKDGTVLVVYYEEGAESAVRARRFRLKPDGIEFLPLGLP